MVLISSDFLIGNLMVRFAKPHVSVISTDLGRNIMVLISLDFTKGNLIVRFGIPLISVIFKNSAAVTNTRSGAIPAAKRIATES